MVARDLAIGDVVRYAGGVEFNGYGTRVVVIGVDPDDPHGLCYLVVPVWDGYEWHPEWVEGDYLKEDRDEG